MLRRVTTTFVVSVVALVSHLATPCRAVAQGSAVRAPSAGPSLDETMNFLSSFLQSNGWWSADIADRNKHTYYWRYHYLLVTPSGCQLTITAREKQDNAPDEYHAVLDFKQMDPLAVRTDSSLKVTVEVTGQKQIIPIEWGDFKHDSFEQKGAGNTGVFDFVVAGGPENVSRVYRAVKHALDLCGAKVSPF
jgi:hypothetical protein